MLTSLGLIFLAGMALGWVCRKCRLPGLLGMMVAGILLGPCVLNLLDDSIHFAHICTCFGRENLAGEGNLPAL